MPTMPNPFEFAGSCPANTAAASPVSSQVDAAAEPFDGRDIPLDDLVRRGFDPEGFLNDIEPLPAFLSAPSQRYLSATDLIPVLQTLAGH